MPATNRPQRSGRRKEWRIAPPPFRDRFLKSPSPSRFPLSGSVDKDDNIVWIYITNLQPGSNPNPAPTRAVQTQNGDVIISDQFNHRVLFVKKSTRQIVAQYDHLNHFFGYGTTSTEKGLFVPYDAKVLGDFTGITPPY